VQHQLARWFGPFTEPLAGIAGLIESQHAASYAMESFALAAPSESVAGAGGTGNGGL